MIMKGYLTLPKLQEWSLTIRYSLVSYLGHYVWKKMSCSDETFSGMFSLMLVFFPQEYCFFRHVNPYWTIWYWVGWAGLDLWHINYCRLFNAKCSLHIFIKYEFIITFFDNILKWTCTHFFFVGKWFHVLLCKSKNLTSVICWHTFK